MNPLIPDGLPELLQDFTVEVLRSKPTNLIEFAAAYFQELRDKATMGSQCSSPSGVAVTPKVDEDVAGNDHVNDDDDFRPPPTFNRGRRASVSAEPFHPNEEETEEKIIHQKTDEQRERLRSAVKNIFLFKTLDSEQLQEVLDAMFEKKVEQSEHVIDQGDDGDFFYVVDSGVYDILVSIGGQEPKNVSNYDVAVQSVERIGWYDALCGKFDALLFGKFDIVSKG
jgi:cAMP-dependent protein kinase regulator